jgi:hypothetical protein
VLDTVRPQHRGSPLDDVALGDAAEIDPHALGFEEDRAARAIEHDVPVVDRADALLDLPIRRPLTSAEVV